MTTGEEIEAVAREYLTPLKEAGVDTLILGCTHYPLLTGVIGRIMGERVTLVTSSEATANVPITSSWTAGSFTTRGPWVKGRSTSSWPRALPTCSRAWLAVSLAPRWAPLPA